MGDDVLSGMELLKARAALRNRLSPPPATGATDIAARLAAANEALAKAPKTATLGGRRTSRGASC